VRPPCAGPHRVGDAQRRPGDRQRPVERRADWSIILKGANVAGEVIDDTVAELGANGARMAGGHGILQVSVGPLGMRSRIAKRLLDVIVAGSAVLALSPLLIAVALAVKLEDGGPVFFLQKRVGRGTASSRS
jgi:hypothetical protein